MESQGAGFTGSHLVARLQGQGVEVVAIDCLWTGSSNNIEPGKKMETLNS
jgi:nucleoside-diphosphate-sugar epimerase